MFKKGCLLTICVVLTSCSGGSNYVPSSDDSSYPKTREERQVEEMGKLTGEGGLTIFGGKSSSSKATHAINVNSYLWRASLDTVHKMPVLSADPFGGSIITDWHKLNSESKERYKLNIYIVGHELRSDAIRVSAFKQTLDKNGNWGDIIGNDALATEIENKILLKARTIKYKSGR
ncbi:MAG: DUF3576 domain-containing protein [Candidatus Jidaibacter sp.]|jgi:hypothetical protein|nr:DUF3576 domain-containing protein [Candidatus Jidaibacter sp.]